MRMAATGASAVPGTPLLDADIPFVRVLNAKHFAGLDAPGLTVSSP